MALAFMPATLSAERVFEKYKTAILRGLDKPNARVQKFEASIGKPVTFGPLTVLVRDCRKTPPEDEPETAVFVEIRDERARDPRQQVLYSGWMFASSPALAALEHPIYDIWALDCKNPMAPPPSSEPPAVKDAAPDAKASSSKQR